ncbi:serine threonine- kinase HT1 [Olea europaea subsp. europaea]|uniref:Serine threonine- kinase HT1 n=1 Tax=Olea europaea subsp. europaea TaxID=158383 RepID=A0A8S0RVP0_OLEEU|nr:serine threonine- kinase HT1 [Olea europaea subsp. europaea]
MKLPFFISDEATSFGHERGCFFNYVSLVCVNISIGLATINLYLPAKNEQERPNLSEDIPTDLAIIIQSCWVEDPNMRPSFSQIVRILNEFLSTLPPQSPPLSEPNPVEAMTSNGAITEFSARARGKFAFLRQLFAAKKARS